MSKNMKSKRVFKPRAKTVRFTPKEAKAIKSLVKHQEFKYDDNSISFNNTTTATVNEIITVASGSTSAQRSGNQILIKSIEINLNVTSQVATPAFCRIALIRFKPSNGNLLTYSNVYLTSDTSSVRNLNNRNDYVILKQWDFKLNQIDQDQYLIRYYKKCNIPITFSSTGASYTDVEENNLFLVGLSSLAANGGSVIGNVRLRFTDN